MRLNLTGTHNRHMRRLQWLLQAPSLCSTHEILDLRFDLPEGLERLSSLADDEQLAGWLDRAESGRLGQYFEALYQVLLERVFGWDLLATNVPVRAEGRTLGELDVVARNPATGQVEHHEVAVKYYLGCADATSAQAHWYGPNSQDRLDLKLARLINHQSTLGCHPVAREALAQLGIVAPTLSRIVLRGYLFYPASASLRSPATAGADHLRGQWFNASALHKTALDDCTVLNKPDWLGPYRSLAEPDSETAKSRLQGIAEDGAPALFARMLRDETQECWVETERFFVVSDRWLAL